jgi:hydrogenase-1 operon protein HyaF
MNARPLLAELRHRSVTHPAEGSNHVISLSLLPLSAGDVEALRSALGAGPVRGVSRGYGTCHVALTERARVWNVQYLNAMGAVVLDTLEVGDVPVALRAMPEDLQDSAARLETLLAGDLQ